MKMPNMCPFEKRHFLTWIDLNPGFGRNWDPFLKKFTNGTLQIKVFGPKKFEIPCRESKVPIWLFWFPASNGVRFLLKSFFFEEISFKQPSIPLISYCLLMKDESFCIKNASHFASVLCMMISFLFCFFLVLSAYEWTG